uniref:RNA_lig_T4_1 domain-containing protein n=1 Tax=Elaeophora elaphi TaxID=1147741 RepID=A0A0R3RZ53_9BILA
MEGDRPDVLSFECYSFEPDTEMYSHRQLHHIQPMKLLYHLTDHTVSLIEPHIPNSSILQSNRTFLIDNMHVPLQGRTFTHQRVPKLDRNYGQNYLHWSDLNVAKDIHLFSRSYRITACDHHTRDFLTKRGIEVNEEEEIPMDPWIHNQEQQQCLSKNKESGEEKSEKNHEKVDYSDAPAKLHLLACWLDGTSVRTFHMIVHTIDDTVALVESTRGFRGQLFLKRNKLPFIKKDVRQFYRSSEIRPGLWVEVFTRPMFIFSCEGPQTRNFLKRFGPIDFEDYEKVRYFQEGGKGLFEDIKFLITFHVSKEKLDIAEAVKGQKWCHGRTFLKGVNCSRYELVLKFYRFETDLKPSLRFMLDILDKRISSMDKYKIGSILKVYRWNFRLLEADDATRQYLLSKESQQL